MHIDGHRITGNFGGFGSGKTLNSRQEFYKHMFLTPNGNTLIGANVASQYEQTIKREIEEDIPRAFVRDSSTQKQYIDFINGHRLMFRPFDDPDKLRSYNLSMFIIVEASEVKVSTFTQLKSRLRSRAAMKAKIDKDGNPVYRRTKTGVPVPIIDACWLKGIVESNPGAGWIRNDLLLKSDKIYNHGNNLEKYVVLDEERDPALSSHVTSAECNEFLPDDFIATLTKNKPPWWVARYVNGSFAYAEGLVYPNAAKCICNTFQVPKDWKRIVAFDYGLVDNAVFLFGAVDEQANMLYIYKEVCTNNRSVRDLALMYHEAAADIPTGGLICAPIIDPKSGPKRDYDKKTLADHFLDYNISFKAGHINVDARVYRLNTYIESDQLRIMDCCKSLIKEIKDYKYKADPNANSGLTDKPEDKNNHSINALEWIVMELPADPKNLVYGAYNKRGDSLIAQRKIQQMSYAQFALSDTEEEPENGAFGMIDYNYI